MGGVSYIASGESEHGEEDDGQPGFWHFGANGSQDGHDGSRLKRKTNILEVSWTPAGGGKEKALLTAPRDGLNLPVAVLQT